MKWILIITGLMGMETGETFHQAVTVKGIADQETCISYAASIKMLWESSGMEVEFMECVEEAIES
jgi:hypothetical protein